VRAFCNQHGTSEQGFYQWRKRLAQQLPVKFALVEIRHGAPAHDQALEVILTSDDRGGSLPAWTRPHCGWC
jgi:hypothetical protein